MQNFWRKEKESHDDGIRGGTNVEVLVTNFVAVVMIMTVPSIIFNIASDCFTEKCETIFDIL